MQRLGTEGTDVGQIMERIQAVVQRYFWKLQSH
jgi:hypothetical protein